jgi:hypothetical protein
MIESQMQCTEMWNSRRSFWHVMRAFLVALVLCGISPAQTPSQPQLTIKVAVGPSGDTGLFNLTIDEATVANKIGNGGVFGPQVRSVGLHVIGQTEAPGTDLRQYLFLYGGDCSPDGSINLNSGDAKTCTITNTRGTQAILPTDNIGGIAEGKTERNGWVGSDGTANYEIPLWVPPGRGGIQPNLSLAYNGGVGNGLVGVGWNLRGFTEITRCRRTFLQDGEANAVTFTDGDRGDRYCLNGERLVAVGGTSGQASVYGADGIEYRTERDKHARIVSYSPDKLGPTYFRVYLHNGTILTLGGTETSRLEGRRVSMTEQATPLGSPNWTPPAFTADYSQSVRFAWGLSRVEDRSGNYLTVTYNLTANNHGYEILPSQIDYTASTPNPSLARKRHISFYYQDRPDVTEKYVSGFRLLQNRRLYLIRAWWSVSIDSMVVARDYQLFYNTDTNNNLSLLSKIQECDGVGVTAVSTGSQTCKTPTAFSWSAGDTGFDDSDTNISQEVDFSNPTLRFEVGDISGDGRDDLLVSYPALSNGPEFVSFYPSTGIAFITPPGLYTGLLNGNGYVIARLIDVYSKGTEDIDLSLPPYYFQYPLTFHSIRVNY